MQVMKGQVAPAERLQPGLYNYIRDKLLNGDTPYTGRLVPAVDAFLANVIPTLRAVEVCIMYVVGGGGDPLPNRTTFLSEILTWTFLQLCTILCGDSWRRCMGILCRSTLRVGPPLSYPSLPLPLSSPLLPISPSPSLSPPPPPPHCFLVFSEEKKDRTFSVNVHQWAIHASSVFSNVMRHCVDSDEHNIDLIKKLIVSH